MKHLLILLIATLSFSLTSNSQDQKKKSITIKHADNFKFKKEQQMYILTGHVFLIHKNLKMYCDKAYKYNETNTIKAFGNIHVIQNDTLHMKGDKLTYDGNSRFAKVRENVVLNDKKMTLTSDYLNYDAEKNIGYYNDFGTVKDSINVLTSIKGQYYANDNYVSFQDSVVVVNPDYTLTSDTLKYTTLSKIVYITGPTNIVGEKDTLYTEQGWFNTISKQVELKKNNKAKRDSYICFGDNIFIDNNKSTAVIKNNGVLKDTANNMMVKANLIKAFKNNEFAFATNKAELIHIDNNMDSLFMHADTLSVRKDSSNTIMKAFHKVKFYKKTMQGVCDSLAYSLNDSLVTMHSNPIVWASGNQITGDIIRLETGKKSLKKFYVDKNSLIVTEADKDMYNQIKGRNMIGYFKNNFIDYIDVLGSGELIFFPVENGLVTGLNKIKCSNIQIHMNNKTLSRIKYTQNPDGTIYPLTKVDAKEMKLKDFRWEETKQPKSRNDIFIKKDSIKKTSESTNKKNGLKLESFNK